MYCLQAFTEEQLQTAHDHLFNEYSLCFLAKMAALASAAWLGNTQSWSPRQKFLRRACNRSEENSQIRETVQMTFENITLSLLAPERQREREKEREREAISVELQMKADGTNQIPPCSAAKLTAFCCVLGRWLLN